MKMTSINVRFINAINKTIIKEFKYLSPEEAGLLVPTDGYVRIGNDYKVVQIIKDIDDSFNNTKLTIHVYIKKITNNDYYLLPIPN